MPLTIFRVPNMPITARIKPTIAPTAVRLLRIGMIDPTTPTIPRIKPAQASLPNFVVGGGGKYAGCGAEYDGGYGPAADCPVSDGCGYGVPLCPGCMASTSSERWDRWRTAPGVHRRRLTAVEDF
jgi:hypothetical protein